MMQRLLALTRKEFIQIRRDKRTLAMMIALPLIWLVMFGYAFSFDVQEVTVAVVNQSESAAGKLVAEAIEQYGRFVQVELPDPSEESIRAAIQRDQLQMGIIIPPGYGDGSDQLRILVDGTDLFAAQTSMRLFQLALEPVQDQIRAEAEATVRAEIERRMEAETARMRARMEEMSAEARAKAERALAARIREMQVSLERQMKADLQRRKAELIAQVPEQLRPRVRQMLETVHFPAMPQITVELPPDLFPTPTLSLTPDSLALDPPQPPNLLPTAEVLYNPELKSANVMIPGLLGLVTMFMAIMMTALGIVREREYGTMEQLVVTPIRPLELMLGKLLPYALVAALDFGLVYLAGTYLFDLTFAGNLPVFLALTLLFLVTTLALGLLVSTLAQNQQQAMQLAMFSIFPQILLSGLIFPLSSLPRAIQYVAYLFPFTYFVPIARGMLIKGQDLSLLRTEAVALAIYAVLAVTLASLRFRKRLG